MSLVSKARMSTGNPTSDGGAAAFKVTILEKANKSLNERVMKVVQERDKARKELKEVLELR